MGDCDERKLKEDGGRHLRDASGPAFARSGNYEG